MLLHLDSSELFRASAIFAEYCRKRQMTHNLQTKQANPVAPHRPCSITRYHTEDLRFSWQQLQGRVSHKYADAIFMAGEWGLRFLPKRRYLSSN